MICQHCGRDNAPNVYYCQGCGTQMPVEQAAPAYPSYPSYPQGIPEPANYAGIGSRFLALLIDGIIIGIPIGIISTVLSAMMAVRVIQKTSRDNTFNPGMAADAMGTFFAGFGFIMIISLLITWAYFALMESSGWQGTLGKRIMSIKVTDLSGNRISLKKATLRLLVKAFISGWFLIGYIMAFFTRRKQSLHDMIAGTLVLTKQDAAAAFAYTQQQAQPPITTACPYCGSILQPGSRFCSNCGHGL